MATARRIGLRNFTILLGSVAGLVGFILAPAIPGMGLEFRDIPNAQFLVRLALTIPALFVAVTAPVAGLLLDRWGRRPVLLGSAALYLVAGTSGFFADSLVAILVGRAFLGVATAGLISGFITVIADHFSGPALHRFMGYRTAAMGIGGMILMLASGFLAEFSWRFPFLLFVMAFPVLLGVLLTIDEPARGRASASRLAGGDEMAFPWMSALLIYASALLGMLILSVIPVQVPFYLTAQGGASVSQVGLALSLGSLPSVIAALQYRRLKSRLSYQTIFALAFLLAGINHLVVAQSADFWVVVIGVSIGGLTWGVFTPNLVTWLAEVTPAASRGRAMGGLTTSLFLGQFLAPVLTQPLIVLFGIGSVFWVTGGLSMLVMAAFGVHTLMARSRTGKTVDSKSHSERV